MVESNLADGVEVLSNLDLFRRDCLELFILQSYVHSVVNIEPFGCVIDLGAIVGIAVHEVAGFHEIFEHKLFLDGAVFTCAPAFAKSATSLRCGNNA